MKNRIHLLPLAAAALFAACGTPTPEPQGPVKYDLSMRLPKGHTHTLEQSHSETMAMGEAMPPMTTYLFMNMTETVTDVDAQGNLHIESQYNRFKGSFPDASGALVDFSTDSPTDLPMAQMFFGMVGMKLQYTTSPKGVISGMAYPMDTIATGMFGDSSYAMSDQLEEMLNTLNFTPSGPVDSGATWTSSAGTRAMYPLWYETTFTLVKADSSTCTIKVDSKVTPHPKAITDNMMGSPTDWKLNGTRTGSITVDTRTGNLRSGELTTTLSGSMITKADGKKNKADVETPITLEMRDTYNLSW